MKLIKLECPNCKAKLEVNKNLEKLTCNFCGTEILVDKEEKEITFSEYKQTLANLKELKKYSDEIEYMQELEKSINKYSNSDELAEIYMNDFVKEILNQHYILKKDKYLQKTNKNTNPINFIFYTRGIYKIYKKCFPSDTTFDKAKKKEDLYLIIFVVAILLILIGVIVTINQTVYY